MKNATRLVSVWALAIAAAFGSTASIARSDVTWSGDLDPADPTTWTTAGNGYVGKTEAGSLTIDGGSGVLAYECYMGYDAGVNGDMTVTGAGSALTTSGGIGVGTFGTGSLNISNGGVVISPIGAVGLFVDGVGEVTVSGAGSTWAVRHSLSLSPLGGVGKLHISDGALVLVGDDPATLPANTTHSLKIYDDGVDGTYITMSTGAMLALYGNANQSLTSFLDLAFGTDDIRYWDESASEWADITSGTPGVDYSLSRTTEENLANYTVLHVPAAEVPEPATMCLAAATLPILLRRKRKA